MKIKRIDVYQVDLPYRHGVYRLSGSRTVENFDSTIVRITAGGGIDGWGESTPFGSTYVAAHALGVRAGIAEIAPSLIGVDPGKTANRASPKADAARSAFMSGARSLRKLLIRRDRQRRRRPRGPP